MTTILRRAKAYSVVGRAVECMRREEPRGRTLLPDGREDGRGGCGVQTTAGTLGARLPPVYRFSSFEWLRSPMAFVYRSSSPARSIGALSPTVSHFQDSVVYYEY